MAARLRGVPQGMVTLTPRNEGEGLHNIKIDAQNIDVDIPAGETVDVDVEVPAAAIRGVAAVGSGSVTHVCKYHSTGG